MAEAGFGRGRGRARGGYNFSNQPPSQVHQPEQNRASNSICETNLTDKVVNLCKQPIKDNFDVVMELVQFCEKNQGNLRKLVNLLHSKCLEETELIAGGVELCCNLCLIEVDGLKYRDVLFTLLQQDFQDREKIRKVSRDIFMNCVHFLCEIFHKMRLAEGSVYSILAQPIITYLNMFLGSDCTGEEIKLFSYLLILCGKDLAKEESLATLLQEVRLKIIDSDYPQVHRAVLLKTLEVSLRSWGSLPSSAVEFYKTFG